MTFTYTDQIVIFVKLPMLEWRKIKFGFVICCCFRILFTSWLVWNMIKCHDTKYQVSFFDCFIVVFKFCLFYFLSSRFSSFVCLVALFFSLVSFGFCYCSYVDFIDIG